MAFARVLVILLLSVLMGGCRLHNVQKCPTPCVEIPETFNEEQDGEPWCFAWWEEFQDEELNGIMECALQRNLTIQQAWNRLVQNRADVCIANADRYPQIDLILNGAKTFGDTGLGTGFVPGEEFGSGGGVVESDFSRILLSGQLAYEVDIWRKIDSQVQAACQEYRATREDLDATALTLSGTITELWFTIQEQKGLLKLLNEQIKANKTQLELIELRFTVGQSSALDVYQQRLTLAETQSQIPPVRSQLKTSMNQLQVLLAYAPDNTWSEDPADFDIELPPFPCLGTPWHLMCNRPDLRAAQRRLVASDYEVAVAIADRLPQLDFLMSGDLLTRTFNQFFQFQSLTIVGNLIAPLIDGGRRRCEVEKRRAVVWERLNSFGDTFLVAISEVEDAIVQETEQLNLLEDLENQLEISEATLRESQLRYMNGLTNYLDVIAAITALQNVERRIISEKKNLLIFRSNLYRALGGSFELG
ncbi:MAG: Toluene efflux pump outer membrane protein TtgI [Chlamydiae bacterium]|nr:Toluene efflux pump outer membrane protein TtgI [Chlamydiota bacterium]